MMNRLKGYRTLLWNLLGAIPVVMAMTESQYAIPERFELPWLCVFIAVNLVLRVKTTTPVGRSA